MLIRELLPEDADSYREIRLLALRSQPEMFGQTAEESEIENAFECACTPSSDAFMLGAFEGAELVGIVGFQRQTRTRLRHRANLGQLFVRPEYAGRGIGRGLIVQLLDRAFATTDVKWIELGVRPYNSRAVHLYESLGFEMIVTWPDYFEDGAQSYMRVQRP